MVTEAEIRDKVGHSIRWVERAIVVIYHRQTEDEKDAHQTTYSNGLGFSGVDADILSGFAERLLDGNCLSRWQLKIAFKKMPKYAKQLLDEVKVKEMQDRREDDYHAERHRSYMRDREFSFISRS